VPNFQTQWEESLSETTHQAQELFDFPSGLLLDEGSMQHGTSAEERRKGTVEVYLSQLASSSGPQEDWADLLLCRNLSNYLKKVPLVVLPAWRWMPEILQNDAHRDSFLQYFKGHGVSQETTDSVQPIPFFRSVAPSLFRPREFIHKASEQVFR